jgi:hypothetical protein
MAETPASVITIEERDGKKRKLELRGPGLPMQGAAYESENRLITEWMTGNSVEAVQQVLGPMLNPSDWEGVGRTTQLIGCPCIWTDGAQEQITRADTLREHFETLATSVRLTPRRPSSCSRAGSSVDHACRKFLAPRTRPGRIPA